MHGPGFTSLRRSLRKARNGASLPSLCVRRRRARSRAQIAIPGISCLWAMFDRKPSPQPTLGREDGRTASRDCAPVLGTTLEPQRPPRGRAAWNRHWAIRAAVLGRRQALGTGSRHLCRTCPHHSASASHPSSSSRMSPDHLASSFHEVASGLVGIGLPPMRRLFTRRKVGCAPQRGASCLSLCHPRGLRMADPRPALGPARVAGTERKCSRMWPTPQTDRLRDGRRAGKHEK